MKKGFYNKQIKLLRRIFEEVDPAGFGALGEYDDLVFKIIKYNETETDPVLFTQKITELIVKEFDVPLGSIVDSSSLIAARYLKEKRDLHP